MWTYSNGVAAICILVGGIGVMNILLVSVRERRREIGIMKSLGTTEGQICLLFLLEALVYALVGGCMGLVIGVGLIETAGRSIGLTPVIRLGDCVAVFFWQHWRVGTDLWRIAPLRAPHA